MNASTGVMVQNNRQPVKEIPAAVRVPRWEQIPPEKQQELTRILAEMLLKQVQAMVVQHEQPS